MDRTCEERSDVRTFSFVGDAGYEESDWPQMLPPTTLPDSEPAAEE